MLDREDIYNVILNDIGYEGSRDEENLMALEIIISYHKHTSERKFDIYLAKVKGARYVDLARECKVTTTCIRKYYEDIRERLMKDYIINFIKLGFNDTREVKDINICEMCYAIGCKVKYCPEGFRKYDDVINKELITNVKLSNLLNTFGLVTYGDVRNFIIPQGKGWYEDINRLGFNNAVEIEKLVGIDWRIKYNK